MFKSVIVALAMASTASASAANELSRPHLVKGSTSSVVSKLQLKICSQLDAR